MDDAPDDIAAARRRVHRAEQHVNWLRSESLLGHHHHGAEHARAELDDARAELAALERDDAA